MTTYERLTKVRQQRGAGYFILLDPDKINQDLLPSFVRDATEAGVDAFLVGGSLLLRNDLDKQIQAIKGNTNAPVVIFPGGLMQVSGFADAILFLMLISGRNPEYLIGNQVLAAPIVRQSGLEAISTGYMLIEAGNTTSAEFMSSTKPIPRDKPDIALAHALAAEIIGMKLVYLDAGSGAQISVPEEMIQAITRHCSLPVIVGGGIRTPEEARRKVEAGASFIVTGTVTERNNHHSFIREFAEAVHTGPTAPHKP
jgi:putative glycerol-1-phosphate prenyltransferase